jgi:hypothetical protein
MNENIKAGGDIHAGDGGYSIGTKEKYDEFVKNRNRMNERIRQLIEQATDTIEIVNPDTGITHYREFFDKEKFAELIVQECIEQVRGEFLPVLEDELMMKDTHWDGYVQCGVDSVVAIREHFFGVEE